MSQRPPPPPQFVGNADNNESEYIESASESGRIGQTGSLTAIRRKL